MDRTDDIDVVIVDGVPVKVRFVEIEDAANIGVGLVHGLVLDGVLAFGSLKLARKRILIEAVFGVVYFAIGCAFVRFPGGVISEFDGTS